MTKALTKAIAHLKRNRRKLELWGDGPSSSSFEFGYKACIDDLEKYAKKIAAKRALSQSKF